MFEQFFGIRHYIDNFVARKWTRSDVDAAEAFFKTHNAGFTSYPFPKDLFNKFIAENDGYFPVAIEALPEVCSCSCVNSASLLHLRVKSCLL